MSYEPKEWVSGEVITADKLNNIEEGVQEALECCDHGYECDIEVLFTESVQTTKGQGAPMAYANLSYQQLITADEIIADVDGTVYVLPKATSGFGETDGGGMPIFTTYPLYIQNTEFGSSVNTQNAENFLLTVSTEGIEVSDCLEKAIKKCGLKNVADFGSGVVEGDIANNVASGSRAHAEGYETTASGAFSHAEGNHSVASGSSAHAEGDSTTASGAFSHAEGVNTTASGEYSHAQNDHTIAQGHSQTAIGSYNVAQGTPSSAVQTDYAFIIGNGTSTNSRSNALAIKWDGTFVFANGTEITPAQFASLLALL